ncbi:MAG: DNA topoisomerase IV subunit A [archaeon]
MTSEDENSIVPKLEKMGRGVAEQIKRGDNPYVSIPVRALSNITFNKEKKTLSLGSQESKRYFVNVAHARKFMQTMLVGAFCKELVEHDIHASIREAYYSLKRNIAGTHENTFEEQSESDPIIVDLEVMLDILREQLHLNADRSGVAAGKVMIEDRGDSIDWSKLGSGGWSIPSNVEAIKLKKINAKFILVVEKNATFDRLNEDRFWENHECILIGTHGQAARGTKRLIHNLSVKTKLPVYVFTDADAYGYYIYSVIKSGSINLAHASEEFATPSAKFIGLTMADIQNFGLEKYTIRATDQDLKRTKEMMKYPWFAAKEWQEELKTMIDKKIKAEQEALASRHLKFVSQEYLPSKIKKKEFLP